MNPEQSHSFMVSMMKSEKNMEIITFGTILLKFLIICQLQPSLKELSFVFTEVFPPESPQSTICAQSKGMLRFPIQDHSVTLCGPILRKFKLGSRIHAAPVGFSDRNRFRSFCIKTKSKILYELINLSMKDTENISMICFIQYGLHPIIVTE